MAIECKRRRGHREEESEKVSLKATAEDPFGLVLVRDEIIHQANKHADL